MITMKTIHSHILFRCLFLLCAWTASCAYAQTYRNGTWYALYDETEHTMNTQGDYETGGIFAPAGGTLNVRWRYEWIDLFGAFRKIDTKVLESANNGSSTNQVGALAENTGKNSNTTEAFSVSRNINWIKFSREGVPTHKVILYHLDIPLAQHILLAEDAYGTTSQTHDFGTIDALSTSEAYTIALRSFLSAGDIIVHSSDPENFRLGSPDNTSDLVYAVGANACASANGTENNASEGTLGRIDNYAVTVYFTPQEGKTYNAEITLSDGVSTATVTVSGEGRKRTQTITWNPETQVFSDATITPAVASSGLEVTYAFEPEGVLAVVNGALTIVGEGVVTATASQDGNATYQAAQPVVRTISVFPAVTRYEYTAAVCEGESYSDERFHALSEPGLYCDTITNVYGSDSIIALTLTLNPVYRFELTDTVTFRDEASWQGIDLSLLPVGDTTLTVRYEAVTTCDSTYCLHLTVLPPTTYGEYEAALCQGDSLLFEGRWFDADAETDVLLAQKNCYGGDSIVHLTVSVHPLFASEESRTIHRDDAETWQGIDLSLLPVGDTTLVAAYQSIYGCDSVYTLTLTVLRPLITTYGKDTINLCAGEIAEYEGNTYRRPTKDSVLLELPNSFGGDSIVELVVNVFPALRSTASLNVYQGDENEWNGIDLSTLPLGDTTLTVTYASVHGCDSVCILYLHVLEKVTTDLDNTNANANANADKLLRNGRMYIRKNGQLYDLQGIKIEEE